ncbi:MAG: alanine racemase [Candidatus Omnitrophica bacterium]|nr:alanine racemase [Candidatus Omnitrophota bacterium]
MDRSLYHRWLEINLDNLADNFQRLKRLLSPPTKILVCVKKDAYGHGIVPVAKRLIKEGVDYLGVANVEEALKLRESKIRIPVLILGMILKQDIDYVIREDLTPTVSHLTVARLLNKKATALGKRIKVHIKVDTGMGRLGVLYRDTFDFILRIRKLKCLEIEGIFTHFPLAEADTSFTSQQIKLFKELKERLFKRGIYIPLYHTANSMALVGYRESHFNMVRPGLMVYGLYPKKGLELKLKPVMALKARVVFIKKLPKGFGISYGHTYRTKRDTNIVVIPVGYGDGYFRCLSNKAEVLIQGRRFRISGTICMDQMMVDVKDLKVKMGEEVVLLGRQKKELITAEELAGLSGTIPYEITTSLGFHLPRFYITDKKYYSLQIR